jgi:hypothetical protein
VSTAAGWLLANKLVRPKLKGLVPVLGTVGSQVLILLLASFVFGAEPANVFYVVSYLTGLTWLILRPGRPPPERAEEAVFNILGRYDYWLAQHGVRTARVIFMMQSVGAVLSFWTDWLLRRLKLLDFLRRS